MDVLFLSSRIRCHSLTTPRRDSKPPGTQAGEQGLAGPAVLMWWLLEGKIPPSASIPTVLKELAESLGLGFFPPQLHRTNHQGFSWWHRIVINQQTPAKYTTLECTCKESCEIFKCFLFRSNHFKNNSRGLFKLSPIFAHLPWQKQTVFETLDSAGLEKLAYGSTNSVALATHQTGTVTPVIHQERRVIIYTE